MSEPDPTNGRRSRGRITAAGIAFIVLGLLILLPSGLCTAILGVAMFDDLLDGDLIGLQFLAISLVFAAGGAALVYTGWTQRK